MMIKNKKWIGQVICIGQIAYLRTRIHVHGNPKFGRQRTFLVERWVQSEGTSEQDEYTETWERTLAKLLLYHIELQKGLGMRWCWLSWQWWWDVWESGICFGVACIGRQVQGVTFSGQQQQVGIVGSGTEFLRGTVSPSFPSSPVLVKTAIRQWMLCQQQWSKCVCIQLLKIINIFYIWTCYQWVLYCFLFQDACVWLW